MPGPPPPFAYQLGLGSRSAASRIAGAGDPPPAAPSKRLKASRRRWSRAQMAAWTLGVGGYGTLIWLAHGSRSADGLHALAILWLIVFGALNAHLILERR